MSTQTTAEARPTLFARVRDFYQDVMVEMGKVTWPSKDELKSSTSVVLFLLGAIAAIVYAYDIIFQLVVLGLLNYIGRA